MKGFSRRGYTPRSPFSGGYGRDSAPIYCPKKDEKINILECLPCEEYKAWDGLLHMCKFEWEELKRQGYYSGDEDKFLRNIDPEVWQEKMERKKVDEEVRAKMEAEWAAREPEREKIKKELEKKKELEAEEETAKEKRLEEREEVELEEEEEEDEADDDDWEEEIELDEEDEEEEDEL